LILIIQSFSRSTSWHWRKASARGGGWHRGTGWLDDPVTAKQRTDAVALRGGGGHRGTGWLDDPVTAKQRTDAVALRGGGWHRGTGWLDDPVTAKQRTDAVALAQILDAVRESMNQTQLCTCQSSVSFDTGQPPAVASNRE